MPESQVSIGGTWEHIGRFRKATKRWAAIRVEEIYGEEGRNQKGTRRIGAPGVSESPLNGNEGCDGSDCYPIRIDFAKKSGRSQLEIEDEEKYKERELERYFEDAKNGEGLN